MSIKSTFGAESFLKKVLDGTVYKNEPLYFSGELWALDEETLEFRKFVYDGEGPDAFFILGTQTARFGCRVS